MPRTAIASVDCAANPAAAEQAGALFGPPTLRMYVDKTETNDDVPRHKASLVKRVRDARNMIVPELTAPQMEAYIESDSNLVVAGFFPDRKVRPYVRGLRGAAKLAEGGFRYAYTLLDSSGGLAQRFDVPHDVPSVWVYTDRGKSRVRFEGDHKARRELDAFVLHNQFPLVAQVSGVERARSLFNPPYMTHAHLYSRSGATPDWVMQGLTAAAMEFAPAGGSSPQFSLLSNAGADGDSGGHTPHGLFKRIASRFGAGGPSAAQCMFVVSVNAGTGSPAKWRMDEADLAELLTSEESGRAMDLAAALSAFTRRALAGQEPQYYKSQNPPENRTLPGSHIVDVVGSTFEDIVLDPDRDVLLEVYSPTCPHCRRFSPVYERFAAALSETGALDEEDGTITIARLNGLANEVDPEMLEVPGFPTFVLFRADDKMPALDYRSARKGLSAAGLLTFLEEHASIPFDGPLAGSGNGDGGGTRSEL